MGSYLVRDAHLLTLDGNGSGLETGDILIEGRRIAAVGPSVAAEGAEVIDGRPRGGSHPSSDDAYRSGRASAISAMP